jgi:membrane protein implicated in regulation of membrane protease activity
MKKQWLNKFKDWFGTAAHPSHTFSPLGHTGKVTRTVGQGHAGMIMLEGELWQAEILAQDGSGLPAEIETGALVKVVKQEGLKVYVVPAAAHPNYGWEQVKDEG